MCSTAPRRLGVLSFASIVLTTSMTRTAHAQEPPPRDEAADVCFSAAERAQPLLRQKRFREARPLLELCARDICPHAARSDCREWLAEATDAQSSIVVSAHQVRSNGDSRVVRDIQGVRAVIDDSIVVNDADGTPIPIDPGRHRLRLERTGAQPVEQDIDVHEGERGRVVDVFWHAPVVVLPSRPVPPSVYVAATIGVVASGVGGYFEIAGLSQRHELDTTCMSAHMCTQAQVDSARDLLRAGDLVLGGGLVFLAGAAILYLTRPATHTPRAADPTGWIVSLTPGSFFAGARGNL
jgi:hypothetical protein